MLNFLFFEEVDSTQKWLVDYCKREQNPLLPFCVMSERQSGGVGSRGNEWESVESAILFSFAFSQSDLPKDLPLQSLSIYVGNLMDQFLNQKGFEVWVKWPNDLYLGEEKVGGIITQSIGGVCVCGIGINVFSSHFASLQIQMNKWQKESFAKEFLQFFFTYPTWSEILSNYKIKFYKNYPFFFHYGDKTLSFEDALLCEDGAIMIENQKIYSLR